MKRNILLLIVLLWLACLLTGCYQVVEDAPVRVNAARCVFRENIIR